MQEFNYLQMCQNVQITSVFSVDSDGLDMLLRLVGLRNLVLNVLIRSTFKKVNKLMLFHLQMRWRQLSIYRLISFKLDKLIHTTKLHSLISV